MKIDLPTKTLSLMQSFATDLTDKFSLIVNFNPEDQLKEPVAVLSKELGEWS